MCRQVEEKTSIGTDQLFPKALTLNHLNVGTILAFEEGKKQGVPQ